MGLIQQFVTKLLPAKTAASIEAESRKWMVGCDNCGGERSVWELGGIRWKAAGKSHVRAKCVPCGQTQWHTIYYSK